MLVNINIIKENGNETAALYNLPKLSHSNSYIFNEVANSYEFVQPHLYDLSKPQWLVGLGAELGVGHSYNTNWQLVKYLWFSKNCMKSEVVQIRTN